MEKLPETDDRLEHVENLIDFNQCLMELNVPINHWGQEEAKTVEDLYEEWTSGECTLFIQNGKLKRYIKTSAVRVVYRSPSGTRVKLKEVYQQWYDGRKRYRDLDSSIGEKARVEESAIASALRGVQEELSGLDVDETRLDLLQKQSQTVSGFSTSYPGLETINDKYFFQLRLRDEEFLEHIDGFEDDDGKKISVFRWFDY